MDLSNSVLHFFGKNRIEKSLSPANSAILNDADKNNIKNMLPTATKYCSFPDTIPLDKIKDFMKID